MARYNNPKTGKTVEAKNLKEATKPKVVAKKKKIAKKETE